MLAHPVIVVVAVAYQQGEKNRRSLWWRVSNGERNMAQITSISSLRVRRSRRVASRHVVSCRVLRACVSCEGYTRARAGVYVCFVCFVCFVYVYV